MIKTAHQAIQFLKQKRQRVKIGQDYYTQLIDVICSLVEQRKILQGKFDSLIKEIARLQTPRKRAPFETEGNGQWDTPEMGRLKEVQIKCICKGYYKPTNCPIHGKDQLPFREP